MEKIILASASPRRHELLEQIGIRHTVCPAKGEEYITKTHPGEAAQELSLRKAAEVAEKTEEGIVIGADTVVSVDGEILGKPRDRRDAVRMLKRLSGRAHEVYTGVTLLRKAGGSVTDRKSFYICTKVYMYPMTEEEIAHYAASGEPDDKAGAYGIQGRAGAFVEKIEGDYNNVVGLPAARVYQELKAMTGTISH